MPSEPAVENTTPDQPQRIRWKSGLFILSLGIIGGVIEWFTFASDRSLQNFVQLLIIMATMLLLTIWWTFFSGVRWRTRFAGLLLLVLLGVGLRYSVRVVGFRGEAFPILAFRWQESAEDRAAKYWHRHDVLTASAKAGVFESSANAGDDRDLNDAVEPPDEPDIQIGPDDWSQFRGNDRSGIIRGEDWGLVPGRSLIVPRDGESETHPKEIWRHPVGPGWSSFAVVQNLAITQEQQQENEAVVCYDLNTGTPIWVHVDSARFEEVFGGVGPRATPTLHDGYVYALGATGILNCLDLRTGEKIWQTNILADAGAGNITWAMSASPLIVDEMVIVNPGGEQGKSVTAYNRLNGEKLWTRGDHPASYSSPDLVTIDGVRQILLHDGQGVAGIKPDDGTELWRFPWTTQPKVNVAMPTLVDERRVLIGSGYGQGIALLDIKHDGDVWSATTDWSQRESRYLKPKFNDFIVRGKYAYGLDEGIMVCIDLEARKQLWKAGRYGFGQFIDIGGMFVMLAESGEVVYIVPDPQELKEVYRWQAIEGKTWNQPAFAHGKLLVRNAEEAACYELPIHSGEF
ncbi:MAG: PQQ-like beta-propeller repeat protein [Planctomycetota bacterium]|nr:PQQ-like beta-propeller repeat protein [Planctomycetota bacterium]